jgi:hypothetical protein
MTTAPKKKAPYKLSAVVSELERKHPDIEVELSEGKTIRFPPPQRWSDEVQQAAGDNVECLKLLFGPDDYAAFIAAGGSASVFLEIIQLETGIDLGKSLAS